MSDDFFDSTFGEQKHFWQRRRVAGFFDPLFDLRIAPGLKQVRAAAQGVKQRDVLVASVLVPQRESKLQALFRQFQDSRHRVTICAAPMGDRGKFWNINAALEGIDLARFDYLIVTDDDVRLPPGFVDNFIAVAERLELKIAQPAHCCHSHASFTFNQRAWGILGRVTGYVEDGPVTMFHREAVPHVVPFPMLRWAWGTDLVWGDMARRRGMAIGIVDCTPIEHLNPVAGGYDVAAAKAEGRGFLASRGLSPRRDEVFRNKEVLRTL